METENNNLDSSLESSPNNGGLQTISATETSIPSSFDPKSGSHKSFSARPKKKLYIANAIVLFLVIAIGIFSFLLGGTGSGNKSNPQKAANYGVSNLPNTNLKSNAKLQIGEANHLTINGQVIVGNTLVLAPTATPTDPLTGQIYYNQSTNQPYYYNGSKFVSFTQPAISPGVTSAVTSLGGSSGAIGIGTGLQLAGKQLALQIQAGNGISVNGSMVSNSGVISLAPGTSNIVINQDGNGHYTISDVTIGLISGTGTAGQLPLFTSGQSLGDSILSQSGTTTLTDAGSLNVQGAASADSLDVSGSTLLSTLGVSGASTLSGLLTANGGVSVSGNIIQTGIGTFTTGTGNVTLQGDTSVGGTFSVTGDSTLTGSLSVGGGNLVIDNSGNLTTTGSVTANTITSTLNHQLNIGDQAGNGVLEFYSGGQTFLLPTNGGQNQTICTTGITCASGGGQAILLGPNNFQTDNSANSVWIYNNNGGNLLNLEGGTGAVSPSFVVDNAGNTTISGALTVQAASGLTLGSPGNGTSGSGNNGTLVFDNSTNANRLELQSGVTNGNLTLTLPGSDGSVGDCLETNGGGVLSFQSCTGGASGGVTSLNGQIGIVNLNNASATGGIVTINDSSTSQKGIAEFNATNFSTTNGVVNTIQNINSSATPTFGGLTLQGSSTTALTLTGTPAANGTSSLVQLGATLIGANSTGTYLGINELSGSTADFLNFQNNGTSELQVSSVGTLTATRGAFSGGLNLGVAGPSGTTGAIALKNSTNGNTVTLQSGTSGSNFALTLPTTGGNSGDCLESQGSGVLAFSACTGGAGGGVTSLNSATGVLNLLGTSNEINVNTAGNTLTLSTPQAIGTTSTPTFGGLNLGVAGPSGTTGAIALKNSTNGNTVTLQSGTSGSNFALTLPTTGGNSGDCLESQGSGVLAFSACTGGAGGGVTSLNSATGVLNLLGTSNEINVNTAGNTLTLSTPQAIGTTSTPTFGGLNLGVALTVVNGGTGVASFAADGILYGNGTSLLQATSAAANSILATGSGNIPVLTQSLPIIVQGNITSVSSTTGLTSGVIASGFGTISTGNNISTTAALQGGSLSIDSGVFSVSNLGAATAANGLTVGSASQSGLISLVTGGSGTSTVNIQAPTGLSSNLNFILPSSYGSGANLCLKESTPGVTSWVSCVSSSGGGGGTSSSILNASIEGFQSGGNFEIQAPDYTYGNVIQQGQTVSGTAADLLQFQQYSSTPGAGTVNSAFNSTGQYLRIDGATSYAGALTIGNAAASSGADTTAQDGINFGGDTSFYRTAAGSLTIGATGSSIVGLQAATVTNANLSGVTMILGGGAAYGANAGGNIELQVAAPPSADFNESYVTASNGIQGIIADTQFVYWISKSPVSISRASQGTSNGTNVDTSYVLGSSYLRATETIATDGSNLYWAEQGNGGSNVCNGNVNYAPLNNNTASNTQVSGVTNYITSAGNMCNPRNIAYYNGYLYWTDYATITNTGSAYYGQYCIGRAQIYSGGTFLVTPIVSPNFMCSGTVPEISSPLAIAVNSAGIFWSVNNGPFTSNYIYRTDLNGNNTASIILPSGYASSIALSSNNIYWDNKGAANSIGVVSYTNTGGVFGITTGTLNSSFINESASGDNYQGGPYGVALEFSSGVPTDIYWTNNNRSTIGREIFTSQPNSLSTAASISGLNGSASFESSNNTATAFLIQGTTTTAGNANLFNVDTSTANNPNLISNGDFDVGDTTSGWLGKNNASIASDFSQAWQGNASLQITATTTAGDGAIYNGVVLTSGTSYTLSFYAMTYNGSAITDLAAGYQPDGRTDTNCTLSPGVTIKSSTASAPIWTRYSCTFTASATGSENVYIDTTAGASDVFNIDGVQLQTGTSVTPFNAGGELQLNGVIEAPIALQNKSDSTMEFQIQNAAGTSNLFDADTYDGYIGIGTTAPKAKLDVEAATSNSPSMVAALNVNQTGTGDILDLQSGGSTIDSVNSAGQATFGASSGIALTVTHTASIGTLSVTGAATIGLTLTLDGHLITASAAPTGAATLTAAGGGTTSTNCSISGNDTSGTVSVLTGTAPTTGAWCTFTISFTSAPRPVVSGNTQASSALLPFMNATTSQFTFGIAGGAPATGQTYTFNYFNAQ